MALEQHFIDRWDKYQFVPELCEEKYVEEGRKCSKSESYHLISEPWWCNGVRKATSEGGSHIFSNVLTAEKRIQLNYEMFQATFSAHIVDSVDSCNRGLAEHEQRQNPVVMSVSSRLPAFMDSNAFADKY